MVLKVLPPRDFVSLSVNYPDQNRDSDPEIELEIMSFRWVAPSLLITYP